jgi:ubiquinone/menaquinone biosynthesis C-methylase UbiE
MGDEYLATGFADVDARDDADAYGHCLTLLDSLPYFRHYKERSYDLLILDAGQSVLEVGSGLGDDVFRMAERVAPGGKVTGVDASARMAERASARTPRGLDAGFLQADARCLPFGDASFDRCRADRTLQHVKHPEKAVREMARVLKPGGMLLAYDNDWGTFSVSGSDDETTRIMENLWTDSFVNRWIGRYLARYFMEAGLSEVTVYPSVCIVTDFDLADRMYNLSQTAERAAEAGTVAPATAGEWLYELQEQSRRGLFHCSLTAFTVTGMKQGGEKTAVS